MRSRRVGNGEQRRPGSRHRSHARVRRVHRGRASGLHPDLWRRACQDGRSRPRCRTNGRQHRRRQHGLPGAEDREAQRRLQPDARAGACGRDHRRDVEGGQDSSHGQDAQGLGRRRGECGRVGEACRGRGRESDRHPWPHCETELQRSGRLGFCDRSREDGVDSGVRLRRLHRAGGHHRSNALGRERRLRRPRCPPQSLDPRSGARSDGGQAGPLDHARRARPVPARLHAAAAERERSRERQGAAAANAG